VNGWRPLADTQFGEGIEKAVQHHGKESGIDVEFGG
jgi:hypothetical protein